MAISIFNVLPASFETFNFGCQERNQKNTHRSVMRFERTFGNTLPLYVKKVTQQRNENINDLFLTFFILVYFNSWLYINFSYDFNGFLNQ